MACQCDGEENASATDVHVGVEVDHHVQRETEIRHLGARGTSLEVNAAFVSTWLLVDSRPRQHMGRSTGPIFAVSCS